MKEVRNKIYDEHDPYKGFIPSAPDYQGWGSTREIFKEVLLELRPRTIVEVGTWKGASAFNMADILLTNGIRDFEIICVDTWLGSVEHWTQLYGPIHPLLRNGRPTLYEQFISNVMHRGYMDWITPFPIDSINAAYTLKKLEVKPDLIYIDAGHEYASVVQDLSLYSDILREGGYLLGDDYFHPPIQKAAADTFGEDKVISKENGEKFLWIKQ
jgi:hypothetical protein